MPLPFERIGQQHPDRHRAHIVDLREFHSGSMIGPGLLLVTEQAESHQGQVDVAVGEGLLDRRRVRGGVRRIEGQRRHGGSEAVQPLGGGVQARRRPGGQYHAQRAAGGVARRGGQRDLGGAAQQQQGLRVANSVDHSSSLLDRSEANTPAGSAAARTLRHSSIRGYMRCSAAAEVRDSLARYSRPPASRTCSSSRSQSSARPRRIGKSTVIVQPGWGNDSGAWLASPKRLSTLRNDTWPERAICSTMRRKVSSAPKGTTNWYCKNPRGPYARFHSPIMSSGW